MSYRLRNRIAPITVALFLSTYWAQGAFDLGLLTLILGSALAVFYAPESEHSTWPWPDLFIFVFAASVALSVIRSGHVQVSALLATPFVPAMLVYLLLSRFLVDSRSLWIVMGGLVLGTASIAAVVLWGALANAANPTLLIKSLPTTVLLVPNDVLLLAVCIPLILAAVSSATARWQKVVGVALGGLCFAAMVAVNSRSALLAGTVGVVCVWGLYGGRRLWWALPGLAIGLLLVDGVRGFPLSNKFMEYGLICNTRLPLWAAAAQLWLEQPLLGHGADGFNVLYRQRLEGLALPACSLIDPRQTPWPHNLVLEMLSSQGLLGTIPFVLAFAWAVKSAFTMARCRMAANQWLAVGLLGAFATFGFAALVELTFFRYWVVMMASTLIGLAAALHSTASSTDRIAP